MTWSTIATKTHATSWTGTATVTLGPAVAGRVHVTIEDSALPGTRYLRLHTPPGPQGAAFQLLRHCCL